MKHACGVKVLPKTRRVKRDALALNATRFQCLGGLADLGWCQFAWLGLNLLGLGCLCLASFGLAWLGLVVCFFSMVKPSPISTAPNFFAWCLAPGAPKQGFDGKRTYWVDWHPAMPAYGARHIKSCSVEPPQAGNELKQAFRSFVLDAISLYM